MLPRPRGASCCSPCVLRGVTVRRRIHTRRRVWIQTALPPAPSVNDAVTTPLQAGLPLSDAGSVSLQWSPGLEDRRRSTGRPRTTRSPKDRTPRTSLTFSRENCGQIYEDLLAQDGADATRTFLASQIGRNPPPGADGRILSHSRRRLGRRRPPQVASHPSPPRGYRGGRRTGGASIRAPLLQPPTPAEEVRRTRWIEPAP